MKKSFPILAIVTLLFVVAAWFSVNQRAAETMVVKAPLYPELANKIQDVARVEIKNNEDSVLLVEKDGQWVLENRGGYPAFFNRIKPLVMDLSKLEIREAKTANPELFSRLQLDDVTTEKSKSKQVNLLDAEGNALASLIVGKERVNRTDGSTDSLYVRKAEESQSYLVKGKLMFSADPADWLENSLINLSSDRLESITIAHGGGKTVQIIRDDNTAENYQIQNLPEGFRVKSQTTMNSMAAAVEELRFDNVNNSSEFKWPTETLTTTYKTFDGLVAKIKTASVEGKTWASFSFEFIGEAAPAIEPKEGEIIPLTVSKQVELLNAKTKGWVYALPPYKAKMMTRKLAELIIEGDKMPAAETKPAQAGMPTDLPPGITPEMLKKLIPNAAAQ